MFHTNRKMDRSRTEQPEARTACPLRNLRALLKAVSAMISQKQNEGELPVRVWCVVRDVLWVHLLHRYGLCEIGLEHLGIRVDTLQIEDLSLPEAHIPVAPMACITPNFLEFAKPDVISAMGGQAYVGKLTLRSASCGD